jgi:hypothetical protein
VTTSTQTALPDPQWRMMNVLDGRVRQPARALLVRCDAGVDDLLALWERGFIAAKVDGGDVDLGLLTLDRGLLTRSRSARSAFEIEIHLTPGGNRWVSENPSNRALLVVEELDAGRGARLTDVVAKAGVDREAFLMLAAARLVSLRLPDGPDADPYPSTLWMFGHVLRVSLTSRGRNIVG